MPNLVQSELESDLAGVEGVAGGVVELLPESLDVDVDVDDESVALVLDDEEDFDLPPRLSVL